ncbi:ankyrin repeat domain-containing protein [Rickettsiella massiliensis]|uniref:ankyrin repeat domain-containing protein n=1 Tax=Rickettsiella massiliensis TaxID=676517 RepID=UPI00031488D9|nr:ankyrin repeat domain-containing protein [Rickettsiella massiliensis]
MNSFANQILFGTLESVEASIQAGADIEEIDEYGFTPLIEAAIANKPDVAALLLEYGADIQQTDATGRSALHWAVDNCNLPLCELLLANKANPNAVTMAGQPVLVYPLLRRQTELKQLLYRFGAKLSFAQDFILAKLIGHRYELSGTVDIVNPQGRFIEVDYEGFFLEFTLDVIIDSLRRYKNHFSARSLRAQFNQFTQIIDAFTTAQALLQYQRYTINIEHYRHTIDALLEQQTLLLLPVAYEGHAISFIKYKSWLIRCDRGENSQREGTVVIYRINYLDRWNAEFIKKIIYQRQTREFITKTIHHVLGLTVIGHLPIPPQTQGNCSWANLEASIPAMRFIFTFQAQRKGSFQ